MPDDSAPAARRTPPNVLPPAVGAVSVIALLAVVGFIVSACDSGAPVDGVPAAYVTTNYDFEETWSGDHPRLREGVQIVEWTAQIEAKRKPEKYTLRVAGTDLTPLTPEDVIPHMRQVTTAREAIDHADLLRTLRVAPGYGFAAQTGGSPGFNPATFDSWASEKSLSPDAIAERAESEGGYKIVRPVAEFTDDGPRIIVLREFVGDDGSYSFSSAGVLAAPDEVARLRLVVSDL